MDKRQKKVQKNIDKYQAEADKLEKELSKNIRKGKREKLEAEYSAALENLEDRRKLYDDPDYIDVIHQKYIDNSIFTKVGNASGAIGENLKNTGESIQDSGRSALRGGLHATGAVWAPPIYLGYQAIKQSRKKPKNKTQEQDLIELIQQLEAAEKDGKINEEQKREFIISFVDDYYRNNNTQEDK